MITNIELTDSGTKKFNLWFSRVAKPAVRVEVVVLEMLNQMQDRLSMGESMVYELGRQYTGTGNPELLHLEAGDVVVTEESDDAL